MQQRKCSSTLPLRRTQGSSLQRLLAFRPESFFSVATGKSYSDKETNMQYPTPKDIANNVDRAKKAEPGARKAELEAMKVKDEPTKKRVFKRKPHLTQRPFAGLKKGHPR